MADAKKSNAAREFFEKFGEKLALGVALLILVGYAVVAFGMSSEDPSLGQVEKNIKSIKNEEKTPHADMQAPNTENWQAKAIGPWNTVVTSVRSADDWTGFLVTKAEGTGKKREIIKKTPVIVPPVTFGAVEVAIDSITVSWNYKDFTNQEIQKMTREKDPNAKRDPAKVTHFTLERQTGTSGKWEVLADKVDVKVMSFVDTKIEPKSKYTYRVTAYSTDKAFIERGGPINEETGGTPNVDGVVNVAMGPAVQTLGIWKLTFTNPMKPAEAKGMVYVKIEKFEKGYGKVEKAHMQYDGDLIGAWEETQGGEPTTKHRVTVKGKSIEVDFNTGTTLISVTRVNLPVEAKRCKPIYDKATGNKIDCEKVTDKRNFDTGLVTYKDDEGVKKVYVPSPSSLDQLCDEHGGRKIIVAPPTTKNDTDEPKVDPKEVARLKKEADAEKLFEEAEKALEKNKTLALQYYNRLLGTEFAATDFVSKNKKPIIEERIAGLKKK